MLQVFSGNEPQISPNRYQSLYFFKQKIKRLFKCESIERAENIMKRMNRFLVVGPYASCKDIAIQMKPLNDSKQATCNQCRLFFKEFLKYRKQELAIFNKIVEQRMPQTQAMTYYQSFLMVFKDLEQSFHDVCKKKVQEIVISSSEPSEIGLQIIKAPQKPQVPQKPENKPSCISESLSQSQSYYEAQ